MASGWVCIWRKLADHPLWLQEPFTRGQAWVDLLIMAGYRDSYVRIRGVRIPQVRGTLVVAMRYLAQRWQWSLGKVQRFLDELENDGQIGTQKNNISTVITILNYEDYQQHGYANGYADGTQTGTQTEQSRNKVNKGNKGNKKSARRDSDFEAWWKAVHYKVGKQDARRQYGHAIKRLREAGCDDPHDLLVERMRAFAASPQAKPNDRTPIHPATWLSKGRYEDDEATWYDQPLFQQSGKQTKPEVPPL